MRGPAADGIIGRVLLELTSPAFSAGRALPRRHTAEGDDLSPPLRWSGAPAGTGSFALLVEDPDAPGGAFVHWLVWNLPSEVRELPEGARGWPTGLNGFGRTGWSGPRPPRGEGAHRYVFRLFALDALLDLAPGATREGLEGRMHGHVLAQAALTGKAWRSR